MSPSPLRSERPRVQGIAHDPLAAWSVDFAQPLERVVTSLLALAAPALSSVELHAMTLPERHELIRATWLLDGGGPARVEAACEACGEGSEFELDLAAIERPPGGEPLLVKLGEEERTCSLPSPALLETTRDGVDVTAACLGCGRAEAGLWVDAVEEALAAADPLGEIVLVGPCVACGRPLEAEFDLKRAWVGWLRGQVRRLMADVHTLALHYHWSEDEVLRIPESRRAVYLDFCEVEAP